jgi:hypothetical protein
MPLAWSVTLNKIAIEQRKNDEEQH